MSKATRYCEPGDVEAYFSTLTFEKDRAITSEKLYKLIEGWSSYMDASLKTVYPLPVTDDAALHVLKGICARLTAAEVDAIINPVAVDGTHKTRNLKQDGLSMLKSFCERESLLEGAISRVSCLVREDEKPEY